MSLLTLSQIQIYKCRIIFRRTPKCNLSKTISNKQSMTHNTKITSSTIMITTTSAPTLIPNIITTWIEKKCLNRIIPSTKCRILSNSFRKISKKSPNLRVSLVRGPWSITRLVTGNRIMSPPSLTKKVLVAKWSITFLQTKYNLSLLGSVIFAVLTIWESSKTFVAIVFAHIVGSLIYCKEWSSSIRSPFPLALTGIARLKHPLKFVNSFHRKTHILRKSAYAPYAEAMPSEIQRSKCAKENKRSAVTSVSKSTSCLKCSIVKTVEIYSVAGVAISIMFPANVTNC